MPSPKNKKNSKQGSRQKESNEDSREEGVIGLNEESEGGDKKLKKRYQKKK